MSTTTTAGRARTDREDTHEHGWGVESRHATSAGDVLYVRCRCGVRRVDVVEHRDAPPVPLSRMVRARP